MELRTRGKAISLPAFFPDATHGSIKGVGSDDLASIGVKTIVVNTYHLMKDNKIDIIRDAGGIHSFMGFNGAVISDSGGFQVMSLIHDNPANGKITDEKIEFKLANEHKKLTLTPETCIQTQISLGTDIIMCLDDCTNPEAPLEDQKLSVERTIKWAKRCKDEYNLLTEGVVEKPLIFGIIQGGNNKELRKKCAKGLIKIGFDGYAYGGWPVDGNREFLSEIVKYSAGLMPDNLPKYAMGVGKPENITECIEYGYNMFDCVLPSRDARHKRLYVFDDKASTNYHFIYLQSGKHADAFEPIDTNCSCTTCRNYTKAYLWHLFKVNDPLCIRLATVHNLRFYQELMERLVTAGVRS
ncbi:MAG: tRNA guanosine(34) transglycosylase Tgt [Patescibacteria group bacterium]|jgi:queuine tRNA-ribosyltransferase